MDPIETRSLRFDRGAWFALVFALLIVGLSAAQVVFRYFLLTDGWVAIEEEIDSAQWAYWENLVGAPSEMQRNDIVTGIDGRPVGEWTPGEIPAGWVVGGTVIYDVLRGQEHLKISMPVVHWTPSAILSNFFLDLSDAVGFLGDITLFVVGFFAFYRRPNNLAARALLIFTAVNGAISISGIVPDGIATRFNTLGSVTTAFFSYLIFGALFAPSLLAFTLVFPQPKAFIKRRPWLAYSPYILGGILLLLIVTTGNGIFGWYGTLLMMALSIISLAHSALTMRDAVSRAQLLWAFGGVALGIGLFMFNFPSAFGWVSDEWAYAFSVVASLGIPVIGLSLAMAVLRYRLFDIDVIIRRTTSYAVLTAILLLVYFGSIVILQRLLSPITGESTAAVVLSTLLIAALFLPLRRRVQSAIDRRFFRSKYDAQQVLESFAATVRDETDLDALTAELARVIQETMQPEFVSVWLKPQEDGPSGFSKIPYQGKGDD